ncbi:DUF2975 domain-containing protein [Hymenobacter psychrophilus]|uniref:DUF2975 domain-containing protein n=1 Tax=Hymenobacter psychrophilus TaxID=651662 RepID=UPI001114D9DD|nr:DUF2975 domain-containing protein [Hymenobacter psychrophilus]
MKLRLDTRKPHEFFLLGALDRKTKRPATDTYPAKQRTAFDSLSRPRQQTVRMVSPTNAIAPFQLVAETQVHWLQYTEPSPWKRLALYFLGATDYQISLLKFVYYALGSWLLYRMLREATAATPFTAANARRLRYLSLLVIGFFFSHHLAYWLVRECIPLLYAPGMAQPLSHYVLLNTDRDSPGAITIVVLSIIAFIYRRGVELHQEAELTV